MSAVNFLIAMVPLFGLLAFLLLGRFPGERTIARVRARLLAAAAVLTESTQGGLHLEFRKVTGGGRLIALSLAGRGPPSGRMFKT